MPKKSKTYTSVEQQWLEEIVKEYIAYIDSYRPFIEKIVDRTEVQPNAKGVPIIKIIARKEDTITTLTKILREIPLLLKDLEELREKRESASLETRGDVTIPGAMKKFVEERTG